MLERLAKSKRSSLLQKCVTYGLTNFDNIDLGKRMPSFSNSDSVSVENVDENDAWCSKELLQRLGPVMEPCVDGMFVNEEKLSDVGHKAYGPPYPFIKRICRQWG